jgi:putative two-component system response regulator
MDNAVKILVVDDDPAHQMLVEDILLRDPDYRVLKASGVREAMEVAEEHIPSLIVCDYYMPDGDGFSLCRKIKEHPHLYDTMFILLSVVSKTEKKVEGLDVGADDYLTKPFSDDELLARIRALLRIKNLQDEVKKESKQLEELNAELELGFLGVITLLTHLIGLRVPNASVRGQRAADITDWICERLHIDAEEQKMIRIAAQLHEIGKITLSDELVSKDPASLTHIELEKLTQFPTMGRLLVGDIPQLRDVGSYLGCQMENFDGTGYPDRLLRDEIPFGSRVLRGINAIEDLEQRHSSKTEEILTALAAMKGTVLDPHIAQLLDEYVRVHADASWLSGKRQISVYELQEGMMLASDLFTGSGIKLLPKNSVIRMSSIEKILQHHHFDPIINNIFIFS